MSLNLSPYLNEATLNTRTFSPAANDIVFSRFLLATRRFLSSDIGDISSFGDDTQRTIAKARAKCKADIERQEARERAQEASQGKNL